MSPKSHSVISLAIVIPAHNEELLIERTVNSLKACPGEARLFVIADNCTDSTAEKAQAAGATVLTRRDPERHGKPYALQFAFQELTKLGFDAFLVVDADTKVKPNLVTVVKQYLAAGADAVQVKYTAAKANDSIRSRLLNIALTGFNVLRPRGRQRLGLSAGIFGNGFAISLRTLQAVRFTVDSLVEDVAYHIQLVSKGYKVTFLEDTAVEADMPTSQQGLLAQRKRWEGGRLRLLIDSAPRLALDILRGHLRLIEPLLDLMLLPLGYHVLLLLLLLPLSPVYALIALSIVLAYTLTSVHLAGGGSKNYQALLYSPCFLFSKWINFGNFLRGAQRHQRWDRTKRQGE